MYCVVLVAELFGSYTLLKRLCFCRGAVFVCTAHVERIPIPRAYHNVDVRTAHVRG